MSKAIPEISFNSNIDNKTLLEVSAVLFLMLTGSAIVYFESWIPVLFPFILLFLSYVIRDTRIVFYFIFIVLPFSIEFYFEPIGFGSDLPSEPLMILITVGSLIFMAKNRFTFNVSIVSHPVFIILILHLVWILATCIQSQNVFTSFKFFLAKLWYVIPFFFFPLAFFQKADDFIKVYRLLYKFLFISIFIVLTRHAFEGFTFASSYDVVRPFFRNHVSYAAISVICLPFVWAFYKILPSGTFVKRSLWFVLIIFLTGIYFSYTRAAILSVVFAVIAYYIFENRWVKQALIMTFFTAGFLVVYLAIDNKYLDLTPNFERTITHTQFDNLIEATYKLEDISSMERVYRWMAGFEMLKDRPLMGFGPGTFYENYKSYSISSFATYVSDNPDKSGIHNYFLMTLVEQGLIGFVIFVLLCVMLLLVCEDTWHMFKGDKNHFFVIAISLSFIIILSMNLINDLIETDKVGPFFFSEFSRNITFQVCSET
jgi:O-antigen ligase